VRRRSSRADWFATNTEIDMTPMIDMVFILLVFFIVSTSFVREPGVVIERPAAHTGEAQEVQYVIAVDADNTLWFEGQSIDIRMLPSRLQQLVAENSKLAIIAAADIDSSSGVLIKVIDLCRRAGIANVSVATKKP